ncbi:Receptor-like protein 9DC3 [Glycine soja]|uniref:Receptor-like protein 9DC3 n=1 Tax=Glycine soja TaxID=3848 RepID=A0A445H793_GLYSO|nr:Receptor-like protein 9DC3 [Glycine soja]
MPSGFDDLVSLPHLNLCAMEFFGLIPSKISHLSKLFNFSSSLVSLSLRDTILQGKLASNILCSPNLQNLDLSHNYYLEGELLEFNWRKSCRYMDLSFTGFLGKLLNSINHLKSPNYLDFHSSDFKGPIPLFLSNLTQITDLFDKLSKLESFDLSRNNLVGQLPSSLSGLTQLRVIPAIIGELKSLKGLNLSHNRIIEWLDLSSNMLMGEISKASTNLHFLSSLNLSQNQLVGMIPIGKDIDTF